MHPAARALLAILALWTLLKAGYLFAAAGNTRRHLDDAPPEIRKTLRNRLIGSYGTGVVNVLMLVLIAGAAIVGSINFIETLAPFLIPAFVVAGGALLFGIKAAFGSVFNPAIEDFDRRYRLESFPILRRLSRRDRRAG